jgi:hypothetical protein
VEAERDAGNGDGGVGELRPVERQVLDTADVDGRPPTDERGYSVLRATIGSTLAARRAGR